MEHCENVQGSDISNRDKSIKTRDALFAAMSEGAVVITPNNRLSNQLLHDFFKYSQSTVHDKPECLPYQAFLRDRYKKARHLYAQCIHPILLTEQQQRYLWREILIQQRGRCNEGLQREVQEAWTRCQHWQIDSFHPAFTETPQTQLFQQWQQQLLQRLKTLNALTLEQLATHLLTYPELFNKSTIIWACFDDFTPQQQRLQKIIDREGGQQHYYDLTHQPSRVYQYPAQDTHDEFLQMIQWIKHKLSLGEQRIGIVVPNLQTQSQSLQRLLQRHIPIDQFNLSLGQPLFDYSLVTHALQWLSLDKQSLSNHQVRLLLHSPYLAGAKTEFITRAQAMQNLSLLQESTIPMTSLLHTLQPITPKLVALLTQLSDYPDTASPAAFIKHFKARLHQLGFPGEYALHSSTYQCFQRFMALFDELLQLSIISPLMSKTQALDALQRLAKSTIFQIQTSTTPIQVLGLLEASGCTFDSVWVCGLTDQCLPQKTNLSAFIPISLQRDKEMPHATPLRELQFAKQLLQRLQNGSFESVYSYPTLTGDIPNLPSPLIKSWPELPRDNTPAALATTDLIQVFDNYLLPITDTETISGGTALLADQAKCPFRAFARHRLHAKPGLAISDGLDASERGQIIHKIMEQLWQELGSQHHLLAINQESLHQQIESIIKRAIAPFAHERHHSFSSLVQEIETIRLHRLVTTYLEWEKQRSPFVVEAVEQAFTINLAGIDFRVRVDRLDAVASDEKWVIDYKSRLPDTKPWNDERPEAPQLLLYALLDPNINTLLFVQLQAGQITLSGLSDSDDAQQGMSRLKKGEKWAEQQEKWHEQLTLLASEFKAGHCPPKPNRSTTCLKCDFPNLCRVQ